MRRYSVYDVYLSFWIVMVLAFGIGATVRGCARSDRSDAIAATTSDLQLLRAAEGRLPQGEASEAKFFMNHVKKLRTLPEFKGMAYSALLAEAKKLKGVDAATLAVFDQENWKKLAPLAELAKMDAFGKAETLDSRFPMQEILEGKKTVSETLTVPPPIPWWSFGFWIWFYLAGSAVFVIALSLYEIIEGRKHPITQFPWRRVDALCMAIAAAPATVPVVTSYVGYKLWTADWTAGLPALRDRLRTTAYKMRLLRHLPKPTLLVAPADLADVRLDVRPATAAVIEQDGQEPLWYVVPGELFIGLTDRLKEKGLQVFPIAIHEPRSLKGFAVQADDIEAFEEAVGLKNVEAEEEGTDIDRTLLLTYERDRGTVEIEGVKDEKVEEVRSILKCVSAIAGGVDIVFHSGNHDATVRPHEGNGSAVAIYHCATPAEEAKQVSYARCFGRDFTQPATGLAPAEGLGMVICDEDGVPVAQVVRGTVYTLMHNMIYGQGDWRREALAAVLHKAVAESRRQMETVDANDDQANADWRRDIGQHREKYAEICFGRFEKTREDLEAAVESNVRKLAALGKDFTAALKKQRSDDKILANFLQNEWAAEKARLMKEFDQLASSKYVLSVQARDHGIDVYTRTVHIDHLGKRHRVGRFKLGLHDNGHIEMINVANTASRGVGYEHPHVRTGGYICWGNMAQSIAKLMADREYTVVVNMIFRFLESYNPHGGVAAITNWKEVSP